MGGGQCQDGLPSHLFYANQPLAIGTITRSATRKQHVRNAAVPDAGHPLQNKVCGGDRACLIKTTNIDPPCEWNTERFRAEYC